MRKRKSLSILKSFEVKTPCHEQWDAMHGDNRSRHCEKCNHSVFNLSEMTSAQAARIVQGSADRPLCVRYSLNSKGEIDHRSRFAILNSGWRTVSLLLATACALLGFSTAASAECRDHSAGETSCESREATVGKMARVEEQQTPVPTLTDKPMIMGEIAPAIDTPDPSTEADPPR